MSRNHQLATIVFAATCVAATCAAVPARAQDVCLAPTPSGHATIQGHVTSAEASQPVFSSVVALGEGPGFAALSGAGVTGLDGSYSVQVPAPATYVVSALPIDMMHAPEFYDGVLTRAAATKFSVTDGETVTDVDFTVILGATLSGTVTAQDGGAPIEGVRVQATLVGDLTHNTATLTDASGDYTLTGLATTNYQVMFIPDDTPDNYLTEVYDDKGALPGDSVNVTAPGVSGIDAALAAGGRIEGTVTGPGGALDFLPVQAVGNEAYKFGRDTTDASGNYSMVVASGTYKVLVIGETGLVYEFFNDAFDEASADDVTVTGTATTSGIDVQLSQSGKISGRVTDATTGDGIPFAVATAFDENGPGGVAGTVAFTDSQGNYQLASNLHTGQYRVAFFAQNYVAEFYSEKTTLLNADPVSVTAPGETADIDGSLTPCEEVTTTTTGGTTTTSPTTTSTVPSTTSSLPGTTTTLPTTTTSPSTTSSLPQTTTTLGVTTTTSAATTTSSLGATTSTLPTTTITSSTTTSLPPTTTSTLPGGAQCGDPQALTAGSVGADALTASGGVLPHSVTAADALIVLRAAVGSTTCALCVCDVNNSSSINAADALLVLRRAVGQLIELVCPPC